MKNYILCDNDDTHIEIAGWFHELAQELGVKQFTISRTDCEPILYEVLSAMEKKGIILKNIILAPNVPIIEY